jgi:ADP-heptose:LPS heptosyltransferase
MTEQVKINVCVFQVNYLGDFIAVLPALRALRELPQIGRVTLVTSKIGHALVEPLGVVDEVIAFDFGRYRQLIRFPHLFFKVVAKLRSLKLGATICVEDECSMSALLAWCSGARVRLGFDRIKTKADFLYNQIVRFDRDRHVVHNRLDAIEALCHLLSIEASVVRKRVPLVLTSKGADFVARTMSDIGSDHFVVIHPFAKHAYQQWPIDRFRRLVENVLETDPSMGCLVLGDQKDAPWTIDSKRFKWVTGTTLDELVVLIDRAELFVGNNSGPMNIAMNQGTRTIGINGPSARWWHDPWEDGAISMVNPKSECVECDLWGQRRGVCEHSEYMACLKSISVESVWAEMARLLPSLQRQDG